MTVYLVTHCMWADQREHTVQRFIFCQVYINASIHSLVCDSVGITVYLATNGLT